MDRPDNERLRVSIRGAVQGVGFRPFVFRLATELGLAGWVLNSSSGVVVEAEGAPARLDEFLVRLDRERPGRAVVQGVETARLDPLGYSGFEIRPSVDGGKSALVLPDIATCPDCLADLHEPANRRFRYPFTNCTNCGPRFSIVLALPYDRVRTTMAGFEMCGACRAEYEDPADRRFHAQPNACPVCGPQLEAWDRAGRVVAVREEALQWALERIRLGEIVALKGLGGFQLLVDARNDQAVARLRLAKAREEKPFALMFPSLEAARAECEVGELEARLLLAPEAPIVLLQRARSDRSDVCTAVAPGNPSLGVMLPYTPLHHLLLADLGFPVVATSGNAVDEPICTDEREAVRRLGTLADAFLVHDRPIARHVDDSIARVVLGRELLLRRARGYAPLPIVVEGMSAPVLGVGPHLKNTVALSVGSNVFLSQHVGDLETVEAYRAFERVIADFGRLYETSAGTVACDAHPDYLSSTFARRLGTPLVEVQHHVAHVAACMAENEVLPPVLGVAWDGTGYGLDGEIWGGEFFLGARGEIRRVAALRSFPLPGGEQAVKEPRRSALGLLHEWRRGSGEQLELDDRALEHVAGAFGDRERYILQRMLVQGVNSPRTTSVGRLFDAVAALVGLRQRSRYEGQAAMELEYAAAEQRAIGSGYPVTIAEAAAGGEQKWVVDWAPTLEALVADLRAGGPAGAIGARFHRTLAEAVVAVARLVGERRVILTGGCFQNRYLTELVVSRLREDGFRPYWHQRVPPNDGGVALGQVAATAWGWGRRAVGSRQS